MSGADVWAVGNWETDTQGLSTFVVRWDGSGWRQVSSPDMAGTGTGQNLLKDVAAASAADLLAVGQKQAGFGTSNFTLVERYTDTCPAPDPTPVPTPDTVGVQKADYFTSRRELRVEATSTNSRATLKVYVTSTGAYLGTLTNSGGGRYRATFSRISNPQNITVRSSHGGAATRAVSTYR